jgi:hypothetical protein
VKLLIPFLAVAFCHSSLRGEYRPNFEDPLERLVYGLMGSYTEGEELNKWKKCIAEIPDGKNRLYELFKRDYELGKDCQLAHYSLYALSQRPDLTTEDLRYFEKEMALAASHPTKSALDESLLAGGLPLLALHPTPEREAFAAQFADGDNSPLTLSALRSLVSMNSKLAKGALDRAIERRRLPNGVENISWIFSDLISLRNTLKGDKLESAGKPRALSDPTTLEVFHQPSAPRGTNSTETSPKLDAIDEKPFWTTAFVVILIGLVAAAVSWAFDRRRRQLSG